jgi:uncharacterized protein YndB with AHSA1/START domain
MGIDNFIKVETVIDAPIEKVWEFFIQPQHIIKWNSAADDWHTVHAKNDVYIGGKFSYRMEAKNGSMGFDFNGTYTRVRPLEYIEYLIEDGRKVKISFVKGVDSIKILEYFEPEKVNPIEAQKQGWQAILNNFKRYVEVALMIQN